MTGSERDPVLDAFTRRLAAIEHMVPAKAPDLPAAADAPRINVVGGTAVRGRSGSGSFVRRIAAPVGLAAAVIVGLVGLSLFAGAGTGSGPAATPTTSPAALYRALAEQPPVALALGSEWSVVADRPGELTVESIIGTGSNAEKGTVTIATLANVAVDPCQASGAGPTRPWTPATAAAGPQEFMDWIDSSSGLPHDPPSPVTIGGIAGLETTVSPGVGSLGACGGVAVLSNLGSGQDLRVGENEAVRLAAIPVGDKTVVIATHVPRAVLLGDFDAKADQLIQTIAFQPTGS